jgi:hypothetical protein
MLPSVIGGPGGCFDAIGDKLLTKSSNNPDRNRTKSEDENGRADSLCE